MEGGNKRFIVPDLSCLESPAGNADWQNAGVVDLKEQTFFIIQEL